MGACFEGREARVGCAAFLPACRSSASWKGEGERRRFLLVVPMLSSLSCSFREAWAEARAPNVVSESADLGSGESGGDFGHMLDSEIVDC